MLTFLLGVANATTHIVNAGDSLAQVCEELEDGDRVEIYGSVPATAKCSLYANAEIVGIGAAHEVPGILVYADDAVISNLTFTAKNDAILGVYEARLTATDLVFDGANGADSAYALYMQGGELEASGWEISDYTSWSPFYVAAATDATATFTLNGCTASDNKQLFQLNDYAGPVTARFDDCTITNADDPSTIGVGIQAIGEIDLKVTNSLFQELRGYGGAGIAAFGEGGKTTVEDTLFLDLSTSSDGGAIYCTNGCDLTVRRSTFERSDAARGAAMLVQDAHVDVSSSRFSTHTSVAGGGAIDALYTRSLTVKDSVFCDNTTEGSNSGAHIAIEGASADLWFNAFVGGSGVATSSQIWVKAGGHELTLVNNSFVDGQQLGAAATVGGDRLLVVNNLFDTQGTALADNNAYQDAIDPDSGYNAYVAVSNYGTFSPLFDLGNEHTGWTEVGYESVRSDCSWEPRLAADSPLIDAGHPDWTDGDGSRSDVGAYPHESDLPSDSGGSDSGTGDSGSDSGLESGVDSGADSSTDSDPYSPPSEVEVWVTGGCPGAPLGALLIPAGLLLMWRRSET